MAYLVEPYARRGTAKSRFDIPPCSGGVQGKTKYLAQPGEKANVQWIIQNPVPGSHCEVKLSNGHPDDKSSYHNLKVEGRNFNSRTGTFDCGDPQKTIEDATVIFPSNIACEQCTLQWVYTAPGYGSMYQCSDISILSGKPKKDDCPVDCRHGGVCQEGLCYCAAGYFGEACENRGQPNQFYEPVKPTVMAEAPQPQRAEEKSSGGGWGFFSWYFLLLFLGLLIAGIIAAIIFFLWRDRLNDYTGQKDDDEEKKGARTDRSDETDEKIIDEKSKRAEERKKKDQERKDKEKKDKEKKEKEKEEKKGKTDKDKKDKDKKDKDKKDKDKDDKDKKKKDKEKLDKEKRDKKKKEEEKKDKSKSKSKDKEKRDKSKSKSKDKEKDKSKSKDKRKSKEKDKKSRSKDKDKSKSKDKTKSKDKSKDKSKSRSKDKSKSRSKDKSNSRSKDKKKRDKSKPKGEEVE